MKAFETTTDLFSWQTDAVKKVKPSRVGALFMDMGTGKTRTATELVYKRQLKIDRVIWYCPVSLKETVRQEILKHTTSTNSDIYVFDEKTNDSILPRVSWYIIGIESMSLSDRTVLAANQVTTNNSFVILDESSFIKGHKSLRTQRITYISKRAKYRLILTGTPISQGVVDLFAQFRFLSPKILGYDSFYSFAANHLEYSDRFPGMIVESHNVEYIAAKIEPYVYQVTKDECMNLPKKLFDTRYFAMTEEQRYYYQLAKEEILLSISEYDFDSVTIFRLFRALQQITCGFWNRYDKKGELIEKIEFPHYRLEALEDTILDISKDDKIIIWAKYQHDIQAIYKKLCSKWGKESVALYHGDIKEKKRNLEEKKFRGPARFFLATPSCGGFGLTLNEPCYQLFYNNSFKYLIRSQAEDRSHRLGQDRNVTYIDIHCSGSIDDRIARSLAKKANVVEAFKAEVDKVKDWKGLVEAV